MRQRGSAGQRHLRCFEAIGRTADALCANAGITRDALCSVGVGIPGTVSADGRRILKVPNIDILTETFADDLEAVLGIPVTMMQDSRAAAWGEYLCGGGAGLQSLICMTLGTGVGTGIVLDGHVYHGGLAAQKKLYLEPLIPYVTEHCYTSGSGRMPILACAALGDAAPLIGAALAPLANERSANAT